MNNLEQNGNFAKPMLGDPFHGIIEKLKGEVEFEKINNPEDCNTACWGSQAGILISVKEAELIVKMYDEMNIQHP